jgi:DNA-binding MarR family transcriptional regulator
LVTRTATQRAREQWLCAARWRRRVERSLKGSGLTFREWLVLDAASFLVEETGDAVSQNQVASHLELERQAISEVIRPLEKMDLVSRGPAMSGKAWRVFVTAEGWALLRRFAPNVESASE